MRKKGETEERTERKNKWMNERMNGWICREALRPQRPVFEIVWVKSMFWYIQMPYADKFI